MTDDSNDTFTVLLVGRTGNGKSSTGNSILGERKFSPRSSSSFATYEIKAERSVNEEMHVPIVVIDGPGIGDTSTDTTEDGRSMIALVEEALRMASNKFNALLVVLKYGVRFTNQEKEAVLMIKTILGEDVIKNYGIIVMTHGDNFDEDAKDEGLTFDNWCDQQTGDIRDVFNECDKRRVMFDNRSKDEGTKSKQLTQLLEIVADLRNRSNPYTAVDFEKAAPGRKKLIVKGKLSMLESKTDNVLDTVTKNLDELKKQNQAGGIEELQKLGTKLQEHIKWLEKEDEGTGSVEYLLKRISITETRIRTMIDIQNRRQQILEHERQVTTQEAQVSRHKESKTQADTRSLAIIKFLFKAQWLFIYCVIILASSVLPRKLVVYLFYLCEKIVGQYASLCSSVLPNSIMEDKTVADAINKVMAVITSIISSQKSE